MTVVNYYTNANLEAGKKEKSVLISVAPAFVGIYQLEMVSGDSNNSIYRLGQLPSDLIITKIEVDNDAFGASGACHLGLYEAKAGGAAKDEDVFLASYDASSALKNQDGMAALNIANKMKRVFEHAGDTATTKEPLYDLAVKFTNVGGTGAGTLNVRVFGVQG